MIIAANYQGDKRGIIL